MTDALIKKSLSLDGHRTSVALEPEFWAALEQIAHANQITLTQLVAWIDQTRSESAPERPLASACRVYALKAKHHSGPT